MDKKQIEDLVTLVTGVKKRPDEVEVMQYLRPNGEKRLMYAPVGKEYVNMAEDMVLSAEVISGCNEIILYCRFEDEPEEHEIHGIAINEEGNFSPTNVLRRLIKRKYKNRSD